MMWAGRVRLRSPAPRGKILNHKRVLHGRRRRQEGEHVSDFEAVFDFVLVGSGGGSVCAGLGPGLRVIAISPRSPFWTARP